MWMLLRKNQASLGHLHQHDNTRAIVAYFRWQGSTSYVRINAFCRGVIQRLQPVLSSGMPIILVSEGDIDGLHCREVCRLKNPAVPIDKILLKEFDCIDIGALLDASGASVCSHL